MAAAILGPKSSSVVLRVGWGLGASRAGAGIEGGQCMRALHFLDAGVSGGVGRVREEALRLLAVMVDRVADVEVEDLILLFIEGVEDTEDLLGKGAAATLAGALPFFSDEFGVAVWVEALLAWASIVPGEGANEPSSPLSLGAEDTAIPQAEAVRPVLLHLERVVGARVESRLFLTDARGGFTSGRVLSSGTMGVLRNA